MEDLSKKIDEVYFGAGDYDSEFEFDSAVTKKRKNVDDLITKQNKKHISKPKKAAFVEAYDKEQAQIQRLHFLSKDAYTKHKELINQYVLCYRGSTTKLSRDRSKDKTDGDVIKENHRFLWDEDEDNLDTWEKQLAKKYYDKLFKEYCLADLSRYKENKIAMRWRTEMEVIEGKGQFSCGHIRCGNKEELRSWEVNFGYVEHGIKKNALVKIRLCPKCSYKLNYHHKRKEITKNKDLAASEHSNTSLTNEELPNENPSTSSDALDASSEQQKEAKNTDESSEIWKKPVTEEIETTNTRDDDFEKYLADMLL